jgi:hypothetical protein
MAWDRTLFSRSGSLIGFPSALLASKIFFEMPMPIDEPYDLLINLLNFAAMLL